jgi:thymidylate synthase
MVAQITNHAPGELIWAGVDVHAYLNLITPLQEHLTRSSVFESDARIVLNPDVKEIDDFKFTDIEIEGYKHRPFIKMDVAV